MEKLWGQCNETAHRCVPGRSKDGERIEGEMVDLAPDEVSGLFVALQGVGAERYGGGVDFVKQAAGAGNSVVERAIKGWGPWEVKYDGGSSESVGVGVDGREKLSRVVEEEVVS